MMKNKAGQSLVEVMIAIVVVSMAIMGIVDVSTKSTADAGLAKRQSQSTAFASEKMESVRALKESTAWTTFCTNWASLMSINETVGIEFTRVTTVSCSTDPLTGKDSMQVTVTVTWSERGVTKSTKQQITYSRY